MKTKLTYTVFLSLISLSLSAQYLHTIPLSDFDLLIENTGNEFVPYADQSHESSPATRSTIDPVLADSLQAALDRAFDQLDPIGLSVAVNFGDGDIWANGAGVSSAEERLDANYVFPVGSISKTITSACIVSMVDEGLLSLDDSIGTWISGYRNIDGAIKIYQLLNHTSGIYNYTNHPNWAPTINGTLSFTYTMEEMVEDYVNAPYFEPGTDWEYSNTNYLLLGLIIESISQKEYHEAVRERILSPNEFDDIVLLPQEQLNGPLAHVWQSNPPLDLQANGIPLTAVFSSASAAGAYASTPSDISEWGRELYSGQVLGSSTDLLFDYDVSVGNGSYGLGVISAPIDANNSVVGHGGAIIYTSLLYYVPELDVSIAVHTNDGTKPIDLEFVFSLLFDEVQEYNMSSGNQELSSNVNLQSYPNPTMDELFLQFYLPRQQEVEVTMYNTVGQQIYYERQQRMGGDQQLKIDMSTLAYGLYFIHVQMEEGVQTETIIRN